MAAADVRKNGIDRTPKFALGHGVGQLLSGFVKNPLNGIGRRIPINSWMRLQQRSLHEVEIILNLLHRIRLFGVKRGATGGKKVKTDTTCENRKFHRVVHFVLRCQKNDS